MGATAAIRLCCVPGASLGVGDGVAVSVGVGVAVSVGSGDGSPVGVVVASFGGADSVGVGVGVGVEVGEGLPSGVLALDLDVVDTSDDVGSGIGGVSADAGAALSPTMRAATTAIGPIAD